MPRLLFVDDDIVTHDPGDFSNGDVEPDDTQLPEGTALGLMGYFLEALEQVGFEVIAITNVEEAIAYVSNETNQIDVALIDVMLPYLESGVFDEKSTASGLRTGFILAEETYKLRPALPIWILSQIVPAEGTPVNRATVDDLIARGIVKDVICKLDCDKPDELAASILQSLAADL